MGVTQEEDLCRTKPLPRATGGQECKRKLWSMLRNVTNARAAGREPRSDRGKKRKSNDPLGLLPPEAQVGLRRQREAEAIGTRRFSVKESRGCCQGPILGKART